MNRRFFFAILAAGLGTFIGAGPALACAGLVTPGGNVKLVRSATLAAWSAGNEHYVTSFTFQGGGAEFGSIIPLPAVPSKVERGGDWTLQRLERETQPQPQREAAPTAAAGAAPAEEVYNTRIDALDITILKGGGAAVGTWAKDHGFSLTPDAPEVLDFYAERSPVFMAARFNADAAKERNQSQGEGTPIHLTIPLDNPWVPLRILGLGKADQDSIDADVYLLTPDRPALLPQPHDGVVQLRSEAASKSLLDDLRSDKGMEWVPQQSWLTYLRIGEQTENLRYDLAMDVTGAGAPSRVWAGLERPPAPAEPETTTSVTAAPSTTSPTTAKPQPKPKPVPSTTLSSVSPTTVAPAPPTTTATPVPEPEPEAALSPALSTTHTPSSSGTSTGWAVAAVLGGGLGAGLTAAAVNLRARRAPK
jgi:hypothetical protein